MKADLTRLPVPADPSGELARAVVVNDGRWQLAWLTGTQKILAGVAFDKVRDAIRAARRLNERNER